MNVQFHSSHGEPGHVVTFGGSSADGCRHMAMLGDDEHFIIYTHFKSTVPQNDVWIYSFQTAPFQPKRAENVFTATQVLSEKEYIISIEDKWITTRLAEFDSPIQVSFTSGFTPNVTAATASGGFLYVAAGFGVGSIKRWNYVTGNLEWTTPNSVFPSDHTLDVNHLLVVDNKIYTGSNDGAVNAWSTVTGQFISTIISPFTAAGVNYAVVGLQYDLSTSSIMVGISSELNRDMNRGFSLISDGNFEVDSAENIVTLSSFGRWVISSPLTLVNPVWYHDLKYGQYVLRLSGSGFISQIVQELTIGTPYVLRWASSRWNVGSSLVPDSFNVTMCEQTVYDQLPITNRFETTWSEPFTPSSSVCELQFQWSSTTNPDIKFMLIDFVEIAQFSGAHVRQVFTTTTTMLPQTIYIPPLTVEPCPIIRDGDFEDLTTLATRVQLSSIGAWNVDAGNAGVEMISNIGVDGGVNQFVASLIVDNTIYETKISQMIYGFDVGREYQLFWLPGRPVRLDETIYRVKICAKDSQFSVLGSAGIYGAGTSLRFFATDTICSLSFSHIRRVSNVSSTLLIDDVKLERFNNFVPTRNLRPDITTMTVLEGKINIGNMWPFRGKCQVSQHDIQQGTLVQVYERPCATSTTGAIFKYGSSLLVGQDTGVAVWNITTGSLSSFVDTGRSSVSSITKTSSYFYVSLSNSTVLRWPITDLIPAEVSTTPPTTTSKPNDPNNTPLSLLELAIIASCSGAVVLLLSAAAIYIYRSRVAKRRRERYEISKSNDLLRQADMEMQQSIAALNQSQPAFISNSQTNLRIFHKGAFANSMEYLSFPEPVAATLYRSRALPENLTRIAQMQHGGSSWTGSSGSGPIFTRDPSIRGQSTMQSSNMPFNNVGPTLIRTIPSAYVPSGNSQRNIPMSTVYFDESTGMNGSINRSVMQTPLTQVPMNNRTTMNPYVGQTATQTPTMRSYQEPMNNRSTMNQSAGQTVTQTPSTRSYQVRNATIRQTPIAAYDPTEINPVAEYQNIRRTDNMALDGNQQPKKLTTKITEGTLVDNDDQGLEIPGFLQLIEGTDFSVDAEFAKGGGGKLYRGKMLEAPLQNMNVVIKKMRNVSLPAFRQEVALMWLFNNNEVGGGWSGELCTRSLVMAFTNILINPSQNMVKLIGYNETMLQIVMPEYGYGSLETFIGKQEYDRTIAAILVMDVCMGLSAMHQLGVVHQDIKAGNILIEEHPTKHVRAVLTDFGISNIVSDRVVRVKAFEVRNMRGLTIRYAPPEAIIRYRNGDRSKVPPLEAMAGDVFSFAIVVHAIVDKMRVFQ